MASAARWLRFRGLLARFGLAGVLVGAGRVCFLGLIAAASHFTLNEAFGLFMVALAASQILAFVATLGTGTAGQYYIPRALMRGKPDYAADYVRFAGIATVLTALAITFCLIGAGMAARVEGNNKIAEIFFAVATMTPPMAASTTREMLARSFKAITMALTPRDIIWTSSLGLSLVFLSPAQEEPVIWAAMLLAIFETVALAMLCRAHLAGTKRMGRRRIGTRRSWLRRSLAMMLSTTGGIAFERIDTLVIGILAPLPTAGAYSALSRVAPIISISNRIIEPIIAPRIATLFAGRQLAFLGNELRQAAIISGLVAIPLFCALAISAPAIAKLLNVPPELAPVLIILGAANVATAIAIAYGSLIQMGPKPWLYPICISTCLLATGVVMPFAYWEFGLIGTAASTAIGMAAYASFFLVLGHKMLRPKARNAGR